MRLTATQLTRLPEAAATQRLPVVCLARHGQTAWTISHQHTGVSDLPLTPAGEAEAIRLGERIAGRTFDAAFTSPLRRAVRTCELAGLASPARVQPRPRGCRYATPRGR